MNFIENFENYKKINEAGEWDRDVDLDFVLDNPESVEYNEQAAWIKQLYNDIKYIKKNIKNEDDLILRDIKGFDKYQGPYANVSIKGTNYTIWTVGEMPGGLWIEDFPIDNTSDRGLNKGFEGLPEDIVNLINNI